MVKKDKTPIKRLATCRRCGEKYETYMSTQACDNICNDPKCAEKYFNRKRVFEQ